MQSQILDGAFFKINDKDLEDNTKDLIARMNEKYDDPIQAVKMTESILEEMHSK